MANVITHTTGFKGTLLHPVHEAVGELFPALLGPQVSSV